MQCFGDKKQIADTPAVCQVTHPTNRADYVVPPQLISLTTAIIRKAIIDQSFEPNVLFLSP
jgi:hypothetical protein